MFSHLCVFRVQLLGSIFFWVTVCLTFFLDLSFAFLFRKIMFLSLMSSVIWFSKNELLLDCASRTFQNWTGNIFLYFFLLRKEVIHPHVPVGIPCYDLTPVIDPTFDGSLHYWLGHRLRVLSTPMVWRAVCTRPENVFTAACWSAITSDSGFMKSGCRLQSELRRTFWGLLHIAVLLLVVSAIVVRV